jgi:hypothetical protein
VFDQFDRFGGWPGSRDVGSSTKTGCPRCLAVGHLGEHRPCPGKAQKHHPSLITPREVVIAKVFRRPSLLRANHRQTGQNANWTRTTFGVQSERCGGRRSTARMIPPAEPSLPIIPLLGRTLVDRKRGVRRPKSAFCPLGAPKTPPPPALVQLRIEPYICMYSA